MCGIFGYSRLTEVTRKMSPLLAWDLSNRGMDSWGMTNGSEVLRFTGGMIDKWVEPPEAWNGSAVSFHNRGASFRENAADPECAHPYTFTKPDGSTVIGMHNGIIRNHGDLNKKHSRQFPVDSMHLFANLAEGLGWEEMQGWANCVWWETERGERTLRVIRCNDQDMNVMTLEDGTCVWCSRELPVRVAARMMGNPVKSVWKINEYHPYIITSVDGVDVPYELSRVMKFGNYTQFPTTTYTPHGNEFYRQHRWDVVLQKYVPIKPEDKPAVATAAAPVPTGPKQVPCRICFREYLPNYDQALFCEGCFTNQVEKWIMMDAMDHLVSGGTISKDPAYTDEMTSDGDDDTPALEGMMFPGVEAWMN